MASYANNYFLNDQNKFAKEARDVLSNFKEMEKYYQGINEEFDEYLKNRPKKAF